MLHALSGDNQAKTTPEYAHNLFNNYALYYDQHMQKTLQYSIPHQLARVIHKLTLPKNPNTLDLGCGTGLTGIVLREVSQHLTGVDIAAKMLAQAKEKGIYHELIEAELFQFLQENKPHCNSPRHYDLIVAADVLPYFGELDSLFAALKTHLNSQGYFIFTTEISTKENWTLQKSARFSHHPDYIKKLGEENQLSLVKQEKIPARIQNQLPLEAMLYVLKAL